jgi:hypothetical protein
MAIKVQMRHKRNGLYKDGYVGFSWTYLFFGFMVPLLRGHYKLAFYHFLIFFFSIAMFGSVIVVQPLMAFFFNKFYTRALIEEGYYFDDEAELVKYAKSEIGAE